MNISISVQQKNVLIDIVKGKTYQEIANTLGISKARVQQIVRNLERKKVIEKEYYKHRSAQLTELGKRILDGH